MPAVPSSSLQHSLQHSPLHERHVALGAKLAEFGGWEMPLEYTGVLKEHAAVREGKKVAATDTITFNYRWVAWKDGRLLEDSYSGPAGSSPLSGLLPGLQKGMVNQTVGG